MDLAEFIELLVRLGLAMQPDPQKPVKEVKDALHDLIEVNIRMRYEPVLPSMCIGDDGIEPISPISPSVRRMLRQHSYTLSALFAHRVHDDMSGVSIRLREVHAMLDAAGLLDATLTLDQLVDTFAMMVRACADHAAWPTPAHAAWPRPTPRVHLLRVAERPATTMLPCTPIPERLAHPACPRPAQILSGTSEAATLKWRNRHTPEFPILPEPKVDNTGANILPSGGGLLLWEFEELVSRLALLKYRDDRAMPDHLKVNEICQLLRVSPGAIRPKPKGASSYLLTSTAMEYKYEGAARLTIPRPQDEAKANAERAAAVKGLLAIKEPPKPEPKGDKKGGGKKKK